MKKLLTDFRNSSVPEGTVGPERCNKDEKEKYDAVYDNTFKQINDGEMIQATIEAITKTDAVVNIGLKVMV